ncbi:MAG: hypothetical protein AAFO02_15220 [Bacteroidota bacterium]
MLNRYKRQLKSHWLNIRSKRHPDQLVIFESDDWGSIRTPSLKAFNSLKDQGAVDADWSYAKYDCLASNSDLERLFDLLLGFQDTVGNSPVITANVITANPNFDKIRQHDYSAYFWEPLEDTLQRYPEHNRLLSLWRTGIEGGVFFPQFHGREHVNVARWLRLLQAGDKHVRAGFEHYSFSVTPEKKAEKTSFLPAALDYDHPDDLPLILASLEEGMQQFRSLFGAEAKTFTAPNYTWDTAVEDVMTEQGITIFQSSRVQHYPTPELPQNEKRFHYTGQTATGGARYIVRNCQFEPSTRKFREKELENCLREVALAFKYKTPAVISTHRLNFVGAIDQANADLNLLLFRQLLQQLLQRWPGLKFATSREVFAMDYSSSLTG